MKKIIAILLALLVLAVGGIGSLIYAQVEHEPMAGQKLIGWGPAGIALGAEPSIAASLFKLINPDCVNEITVNRVSVFKDDGTVIYEGLPIVGLPGELLAELTDPLQPHQSVNIFLPIYVIAYEMELESPLDLNENPPPEPADWPNSAYYSVEIFWTGSKDGLPLTGWIWLGTIVEDSGGNYTSVSTSSMTQMINMEQISIKSK